MLVFGENIGNGQRTADSGHSTRDKNQDTMAVANGRQVLDGW